MTGLAGWFRRDGAPVPPDGLSAMTAAAAHRSPGGWTQWRDGPIGLATGDQPLGLAHDPAVGVAVAFEGRLDNRGDLERQLGQQPSDAQLVLAGYERFGPSIIPTLLGDFAVLIWDAHAHRIVCARDYVGMRPLLYAASEKSVILASEPQQVLAHSEVTRTINEGMVAEYLTGYPVTADETLWRDVRILPPAHVLVVTSEAVRLTRYWQFDPEPRHRHATTAGYAEELRCLLDEATRCRVREARGVGVYLSGGIDSSAVAGAAQMLARRGQSGPVRSFSLVFPGQPLDESPYIDAVVRHWDLEAIRHAPDGPVPRERLVQEARRHLDVPCHPGGGAALEPLQRCAVNMGIEVLLNGCGGDEWFTGTPETPRQLLRRGQALRALRELAACSRRPSGRLATARAMAGAMLPEAVARRLRPPREAAYPWINQAFARRTGLAERLVIPPAPPFPSVSQRKMYQMSNSPQFLHIMDREERVTRASGLDDRAPLLDRRIAQFGFSLPEEQRLHQGRQKVALRAAVADLLPPAVVARSDKAEFSGLVMSAIEAMGGRDGFRALRTEEAGWVDGYAARRRYQEAARLYKRGDQAYISLIFGVWEVLRLEMFLEAAGLAG